jgi:hypothetical protein
LFGGQSLLNGAPLPLAVAPNCVRETLRRAEDSAGRTDPVRRPCSEGAQRAEDKADERSDFVFAVLYLLKVGKGRHIPVTGFLSGSPDDRLKPRIVEKSVLKILVFVGEAGQHGNVTSMTRDDDVLPRGSLDVGRQVALHFG